jgi:hypothetical protein
LSEKDNPFYKLSLSINYEDTQYHLNGIGFLTKDSCLLNLFGPFGINVAKLKGDGDSFILADIQNKVLYVGTYKNFSENVRNIFLNNYNNEGQKLICSLVTSFSGNLRQNRSERSDSGCLVEYSGSGSKKKNIKILIKGNNINVAINIKLISDLNSKASYGFLNYKSFKIIPIIVK